MADESPADPIWAANDKIRDVAKWMISAAAAVGAALIAGSQLSSIGKLDVCTPTTLACARLPVATAGAVLALAAISYLMWRAIAVLMPVGVTLAELDQEWDAATPRADVAFFKKYPPQLGAARPAVIETERVAADAALKAAREALAKATTAAQVAAHAEKVKAAEAAFTGYQQRVRVVTGVAQHELLKDRFRTLVGHLLGATAVVALGVIAFAWASNPPEDPPASAKLKGAQLVGADLQGADLHDADLTGANLTRADLRGATLTGATVKDVVWSETRCPDGTLSDQNGGTCLGHLTP